jgi:hypothetical protein
MIRTKMFFGALCIVLAGGIASGNAFAQQLFRCGKVYQDRPCETGDQKAVQGPAMGRAPVQQPPAAEAGAAGPDPVCVQRGYDSQKIVFAREGGATQERLQGEATSNDGKKLVADVFRQRGTAGEVRARIQAECQAAVDERARAAALYEIVMKGGGVPPQAAPAAPAVRK